MASKSKRGSTRSTRESVIHVDTSQQDERFLNCLIDFLKNYCCNNFKII